MRGQNRDLLLLVGLSLAVRLLAIVPVQQPGYMDAAYSYDIALNLVRGGGFTEPFLWNYLDDPAGLPHPSHLYWMPLPTVLAWIGLVTLGQTYRAAQLPFVALSALLPLVSYWTARQVSGRRRHAWLAGLLTVFSGFYVLYWGHTDNFTPFAVVGSMSLIAAWQAGRTWESDRRDAGWALAAGALVGLAHLARTDGVLLLGAIGLVWGSWLISQRQRAATPEAQDRRLKARDFLFLGLGYALVMSPWLARNWWVTGALLPTAGAQSMWLTTYDDLFSYGRQLSLSSYLAWGPANILRSKLGAMWLNAQTMLAVWCMVFLAPLAAIGWWRLRRHGLFQLAACYAVLLTLAMTLVFTFPGPRGGLFHSGGALLPFIFTAAIVGLDVAVEWVAIRRPSWDARLAQPAFGIGLVGLAVLVSAFLVYRGIAVEARWRPGDAAYANLVEWLNARGENGTMVMLGDPPSYWYHGGGPSIVVPNEPVDVLLAAADRYGARYLALDRDRPRPLADLYEGEEAHPRLQLVARLGGDLVVYRIDPVR